MDPENISVEIHNALTAEGLLPSANTVRLSLSLAKPVREWLASAWDEGNRFESEYLDAWGQFSPNPVNPYRATPTGEPEAS